MRVVRVPEQLTVTNLGYERGVSCCGHALAPVGDLAAGGCVDQLFRAHDDRLVWELRQGALDEPAFCRYGQLWLGQPGEMQPAWESDGIRFAFAGWMHEPITSDAELFLATLAEPRIGMWRWRVRCLTRQGTEWIEGAEGDFGFMARVGEISPDNTHVLILGGPDLVVLGLPGLEMEQRYPAPPGYHAAVAHYAADGRWLLAAFGRERKRSELMLIDTLSGQTAELGKIQPGEWTVESDLLPAHELVFSLPIYDGRIRFRVRGPGTWGLGAGGRG